MLVSYNKFDASKNLAFTELADNERVASQKIAYPRCKMGSREGQLLMQSPFIKLDSGGIPSNNSPYHPTVKSRANGVKIPLEANPNVHEESKESLQKRSSKLAKFRSTLEGIDKHMVSNEMKIQLFGSVSKAKKYEYVPLVRHPQEIDSDSDDEDGEEKEVKHRPVYCKSKIDLVWGTDDEVQTKVFRENDESSGPEDKYLEVDDVKTLEDLRKYMRYMSVNRYVFHFCKLWCDKQPANGGKYKKYGITLKIKRVIPDKNQVVVASNDDIDDVQVCVDSDDEGEEEVIKNYMKENSTVNANSDDEDDDDDDNNEDNDDSDEDSDDDSDEPEEEVTQKTKPRKRRPKNKV